jgi:hypothetical protein
MTRSRRADVARATGEPQHFFTEARLVAELDAAGFVPVPRVPSREYNRPQPGTCATPTLPAIYDAAFRRT